jgi:hypothetical protein
MIAIQSWNARCTGAGMSVGSGTPPKPGGISWFGPPDGGPGGGPPYCCWPEGWP